MKKILALLLLGAVLMPATVEAALPGFGVQTGMTVRTMLEQLGRLLGMLAIAVGIGFLMLGVFKFATAAGDPKVVEEAKVNLVWALIGIGLGAILYNSTALLQFFGL